MQNILLTAGIVCVIAAVVGGGLQAFNITVPVVGSRGRQLLLFGVGVVFIAGAFVVPKPHTDDSKKVEPPADLPIAVSPNHGSPGTEFTLTGSGFAKGEKVRVITQLGGFLGETAADSSGTVSVKLKLPDIPFPSVAVLVAAQGVTSGRSGSTLFTLEGSPF